MWHAFRLGLAGLTRTGRWFSFGFSYRVPRGYEAGSLGLFLRWIIGRNPPLYMKHAFRLRLTGPTRIGRWFSFGFGHRVPRGYEASSLWYASSTGPIGPTRVVVGFRRGGRDLFCGALCLRVRLTRVVRLYITRVSPEACRPDACRSMV
jgi:hypothetical protein